MAGAMFMTRRMSAAGVMTIGTARRVFNVNYLSAFSRQALPDDPVGTTTVTFNGVNANSEIRVYLPDTTEVAGVELCSANHALTWSVYAGGSPNNTVRIVVIHPDYKIKEFTYTVSLGNQSLPVQQERDQWYSNP